MHFTKEKNIPGVAVFLDFEKAFDSIEWIFIQFRSRPPTMDKCALYRYFYLCFE